MAAACVRYIMAFYWQKCMLMISLLWELLRILEYSTLKKDDFWCCKNAEQYEIQSFGSNNTNEHSIVLFKCKLAWTFFFNINLITYRISLVQNPKSQNVPNSHNQKFPKIIISYFVFHYYHNGSHKWVNGCNIGGVL